jgi:Ca2+-binding EF-hand superfamily protein
MNRYLFAYAALILIVCACASSGSITPKEQAQNTPQKSGSDYVSKQERISFKDYDTNNDNKISTDEYVSKQESLYNKIDKNSDNEISTEEFLVYWCSDASINRGIEDPSLGPIYREMGKNNDGKITVEECKAYWVLKFKEYDLDNNNRITRNEYNMMVRDRFKALLDGPDQNGYITNQEYDSFWPTSVRPW